MFCLLCASTLHLVPYSNHLFFKENKKIAPEEALIPCAKILSSSNPLAVENCLLEAPFSSLILKCSGISSQHDLSSR